MYRIIFDPSEAVFIVQILLFGIIWRTVKRAGDTLFFSDHRSAVEWAHSIGLDAAYLMQALPRTQYEQIRGAIA